MREGSRMRSGSYARNDAYGEEVHMHAGGRSGGVYMVGAGSQLFPRV
jgi:hypothetical protein